MTQEFRIWKPEHHGHAPPNWRKGMKWTLPRLEHIFNRHGIPTWSEGDTFLVEPEALNSPNDDASGDIPAFPTHGQAEGDDPRNQILSGGMMLRDYFAAAALQGLLANPNRSGNANYFAGDAYYFADAMIAERSTTNDQD